MLIQFKLCYNISNLRRVCISVFCFIFSSLHVH